MRSVLYAIVQLVWGLPQTLAGLFVLLIHRNRPHFRYRGAVVTTWKSRKALSLGPFVFMNGSDDVATALESVDRPLLVHEYGHTIQSLFLGPLYLPAVGLPSAIWFNVPALSRMRSEKGVSYYGFYTERSANWLGERIAREPSPSA
ncbi:MAG: hypothetical protein J6D25_00310 [Eggerthellaceae bacterium]|nr:hypothetical protein [Eggerthellaceae bacterium]